MPRIWKFLCAHPKTVALALAAFAVAAGGPGIMFHG
jgi:hypothetical protein